MKNQKGLMVPIILTSILILLDLVPLVETILDLIKKSEFHMPFTIILLIFHGFFLKDLTKHHMYKAPKVDL